jgi:predicted nucleic acid-binding protein
VGQLQAQTLLDECDKGFAAALRLPARLVQESVIQVIQPGPRHWGIFRGVCQRARASGNLVQDAWLAALAIESGCEWITTDRDYARFDGLRWRAPF